MPVTSHTPVMIGIVVLFQVFTVVVIVREHRLLAGWAATLVVTNCRFAAPREVRAVRRRAMKYSSHHPFLSKLHVQIVPVVDVPSEVQEEEVAEAVRDHSSHSSFRS